MPIPTLTTAQQFQNSVNAVPLILSQMLNPQNQQGLTNTYNKLYNTLFANPNGDAASAVANLGTGAANVLTILSSLNTFLTGAGVTGLPAMPTYKANTDGSVTMKA